MKVSIAMVTYRHEHFLAEAIESVLKQRTTFDFELVIGDDCSLPTGLRRSRGSTRQSSQTASACTSSRGISG